MFAIIGTMIVFGITVGIGLVAYAMYLTWEPGDDREKEEPAAEVDVTAKELKVGSA